MPTPEILRKEQEVREKPEEFIVPETLAGDMNVVQKNFTAQVNNSAGQPLIQTPPTQVIAVNPPFSQTDLQAKSKGSTTASITWLAAFWIRVIKRAIHNGWKVIFGRSENAK